MHDFGAIKTSEIRKSSTQSDFLPRIRQGSRGFWPMPASEFRSCRQEKLLRAINAVAFTLFLPGAGDFNKAVTDSLGILCRSVNGDRAAIWKNNIKNDRLYVSRLTEWNSQELIKNPGTVLSVEFLIEDILPNWEVMLLKQKPEYSCNDDLPEPFRSIAMDRGICSVLTIPVIAKGNYWGFVSFSSSKEQRVYSSLEEELLRLGGALIGSSIGSSEYSREHFQTIQKEKAAEREYPEFFSDLNHELRVLMHTIEDMTELVSVCPEMTEQISVSSKKLFGIIDAIH